MKKLTVVIVSYNVKHYLEQCIRSVQWAIRDLDADIVVVDNHSRDNSPEFLRHRFGKSITLISSKHNLGFSKANNIAIRQTDSEYVLLLNPDTIVTENSLKEVVDFMDAHPHAGGAGVRMIDASGLNAKESRRGVPTPMTSFYKMVGLCSRFPKSERFGHYYMSDIPWDEPHQIEIMSGAFCMLRRKALDEVGLLDEDFFMYGEDIDLSYRILLGGWENWYVPSVIMHYKGESTQKSSFRYVHVFYDAMLIFFRKHYGHMSFLITLPIKTAVVAKATIALIKMTSRSILDSIGMRPRRDRQWPHFVFIGSSYMLSQCRSIARDTALDAEYIEGTIGTLPEGHTKMEFSQDHFTYIIYDVHSYQYEQIFDLFHEHTNSCVRIGTYDTTTHYIITEHECITSPDYEEDDEKNE